MGIFKGIKQMKEAVAGAPGMIEQAQQLQAAADQQAAAQQATAQQAAAAVPPGGSAPAPGTPSEADLEPVNGVSLERYAAVSRDLGARGAPADQAPAVAAGHGIAAGDWHAAVAGWNQRMAAVPAIAVEFNRLYREE